MPQASAVLFVGRSSPVRNEFGAFQVPDFQEAKHYLDHHQPSIIVFGFGKGFEEFCECVTQKSPQAIWILASQGLPPSQVILLANNGHLHELIDHLDDPAVEDKLRVGLEVAGETRQKLKLAEMFAEQSHQLKRLSSDLETRVEKRHKALRKSLHTLEGTKHRLESFHHALLGIHRAETLLQMEQSLHSALRESLAVEWVRVRYSQQSLMQRQVHSHVLRIDIPISPEHSHAEVLFSKREEQPFNSIEIDFLHELTEALALALSRLIKLEQAETLKAQWQATFDSIPHALCLTTNDFEILKLNRAFQQACHTESFRSLIGKNCFQVFFGPEYQPPPNMVCPFTFRNSRTGVSTTEHFEVIGEPLGMPLANQPVQMILMRSITEEVRFERRILESSKLAELGTIGSSIAHELNNPLGGMLSFLQLILMDLKPEEKIYPEIKEMEAAVLRCRDIILNLLGFSRKQDLGEFASIDLYKVIERAVKLIELQSKSKGILISVPDTHHFKVSGSLNALSQALCNLLQNSIDAISEKLNLDPTFLGEIKIQLQLQEKYIQIRLTDNGTGIRTEDQSQIFNPHFTTRDPGQYQGTGLTTAYGIVTEHSGTLEILSQTGSGTTAIISLPVL